MTLTNNPISDSASADYIQRFHFENAAVRGAIVKLSNSYVEALNGHDYPAKIESLLGECLAASVLMNTNIKKPTRLSLQARGNGSVQLLMAESMLLMPSNTNTSLIKDDPGIHQTIRALARLDSNTATKIQKEHSLQHLIGNAHLAITMEPQIGERYQGIVALEDSSLSSCLEKYFLQSEQLPTHILLHATAHQAAGLMIQHIPDTGGKQHDSPAPYYWEEIVLLANSLKKEELISLDAKTSLHRLFHQHPYRLMPGQVIEFACTCSQERTASAISQIDPIEVEAILKEDGEIVMDCEFCSTRYRFDRTAIEHLAICQQDTRH